MNKAELLDKLIVEVEQKTRLEAILVSLQSADLIVYDGDGVEISLSGLIQKSNTEINDLKNQLLDELDNQQEEEEEDWNELKNKLHREDDIEDETLEIY